MKKYLFSLLILFPLLIKAQPYTANTWSFNSENLGFVSQAYTYNHASLADDSIYYQFTGTDYVVKCYVPIADNKLAGYPFIPDAGGFIRLDSANIGYLGTTAVASYKENYSSTTGTWQTAGAPNVYATTVGATCTLTFIGTGIDFYSVRTNVGGLWSFSVDGGAPVLVSVYRSATNYAAYQIARGLTNTTHTIVGTFLGQDPDNPVATPRGWAYYGTPNKDATNNTFIVYKTNYSYIREFRVIPNSNVEIAVDGKKYGAAYDVQKFPYHGVVTTTPTIREIKVDNNIVSLWTTLTSLGRAKKIEITASYNCFNSNEPTENYIKLDTYYKIDKYGFYVEYTATALQKCILSGYPYMLPLQRGWADSLYTDKNSVYSLALSSGIQTAITENETIRSLKVVSNSADANKKATTITSAFILQNCFRIGKTDKGYPAIPHNLMFLDNRNDVNIQKVYIASFLNTVLNQGDVFMHKAIYYIGRR